MKFYGCKIYGCKIWVQNHKTIWLFLFTPYLYAGFYDVKVVNNNCSLLAAKINICLTFGKKKW